MASNIFGSPVEPQNVPKRSNPPGGKESGIFQEPDPVHIRKRTNPPGGKTSNIFGDTECGAATVRPHPNKPKDNICLREGEGDSKLCVKAVENIRLQEVSEQEKKDVGKVDKAKEPNPTVDDHEPRLGPLPRSHNRVLNPPGGKSNITLY
ncbi:jupiter microtubule associated homolog 2 [Microcaecilia unicolor]|uniref:Jupiter microtubule associated homolog 2 n=1 Tax=Microcaecilia unicolor TaxID=1415580 RepID=A0A6P7Z1M2_9AMPH|nr:jupiter microtubule associated homolog 2 [Microcaecilia unicolor]XP_030069356.1 jupiter microtubule associated homolog 2 [Microcaecilia unicolor]XP_030069357.1 jupiter microtubule associated homolog 2 [Microcaecilia unicolor]